MPTMLSTDADVAMLAQLERLDAREKEAKAEILRLNREAQLMPSRLEAAHRRHNDLLKAKVELRRELGLLP
jgi:hypothetical protein